jgi:hypothetical protein
LGFGGGFEIGLAQPIIGVGLAGFHDGVGKSSLAVRYQAADVIGVHMGHQHLIDLLWSVARCLEAGQQLAEGGSKKAAGAAVDQR